MPTGDYFKSAYPDDWTILGIRLEPFSLGHYFKLKRIGCAFVSDKAETATLGDLLIGIIVCRWPSDPDKKNDQFWTWLGRIRIGWRYKLLAWVFRKKAMTPAERDIYEWGKNIRKFDFQDKVKLFAQYIKEHSAAPGFWEKENAGNSVEAGGHWSHGVLHVLTSKCGYTLREAYNIPMGKAIADFYKHIESEGGGRLMTPEESEALGI